MKRVLMFSALAVSTIVSLPASAQMLDDFNDGFDFSFWGPGSVGGPNVNWNNGRVEMLVPSYSSGDSFWAAIGMKCVLRGDYDIQVDFDLLGFPFQNGVRCALGGESAMQITSFGDPINDFPGFDRLNYIHHSSYD